MRLPALRVVNDDSSNFLWDGYHTFHALRIAGFTQYHCDITRGDFRKAVFLSCSIRRQHGIERTEEDIHHQIDTLLRDPNYGAMSTRTLGRHVGVSHMAIQRRRDFWRSQQTSLDKQEHWAVNGTEPDPKKELSVDQPLTPTVYLPEHPDVPNENDHPRAKRLYLNRQASLRFISATKTLTQARTHLTKLKRLRPSQDVNRMLKQIGAMHTSLAKLLTESESLSRRL